MNVVLWDKFEVGFHVQSKETNFFVVLVRNCFVVAVYFRVLCNFGYGCMPFFGWIVVIWVDELSNKVMVDLGWVVK